MKCDDLNDAIADFRKIAADSRAEAATTTDPELRKYLTARAHGHDREASAMEEAQARICVHRVIARDRQGLSFCCDCNRWVDV